MDYSRLPDELQMHILSYIPRCKLKFNYHPGLVNNLWLMIFRKVNSPCDIRYMLLERKYCVTHYSNKYCFNCSGQKILK